MKFIFWTGIYKEALQWDSPEPDFRRHTNDVEDYCFKTGFSGRVMIPKHDLSQSVKQEAQRKTKKSVFMLSEYSGINQANQILFMYDKLEALRAPCFSFKFLQSCNLSAIVRQQRTRGNGQCFVASSGASRYPDNRYPGQDQNLICCLEILHLYADICLEIVTETKQTLLYITWLGNCT